MMSPTEHRSIIGLLHWLFTDYEARLHSSTASKKLAELEKAIVKVADITSMNSVSRLFDVQNPRLRLHDFQSNQLIPMRPVVYKELNMVPLLAVSCDDSNLRFKVALCYEDQKGDLNVLPVRFETSEDRNQLKGNHQFSHLQYSDAMTGLYMPIPELPQHQPSYALDANDGLTLAVCMIVSIYGLEVLQQMKLTAGKPWNDVFPVVKNMRLYKTAKELIEADSDNQNERQKKKKQ